MPGPVFPPAQQVHLQNLSDRTTVEFWSLLETRNLPGKAWKVIVLISALGRAAVPCPSATQQASVHMLLEQPAAVKAGKKDPVLQILGS